MNGKTGVFNVDTTQKPITVVSHCYGYGGVELGLQRIFGERLVTIGACEIEAFAIQNGIAKVESGIFDREFPFFTNIKTFPFGKFRGLVDIYTAGFPCQPWSTAGLRKGDEDPRHLFPFIKQGLVDMQPEWVFLENVEGIISAKLATDIWNDPIGTPVLLHVLRELERVGYEPKAGIFSASEVGAPPSAETSLYSCKKNLRKNSQQILNSKNVRLRQQWIRQRVGVRNLNPGGRGWDYRN